MSSAGEPAAVATGTQQKPTKSGKSGDGAAKREKRNAINDTAAHVLKGACAKVLGATAALTASVLYASAAKGSLVLELAAAADGSAPPKPSDDDLASIVAMCNDCIRRDVPVQVHTLTRAEADARFTGDGVVNHCALHDKPARKKNGDGGGDGGADDAKSGEDMINVVEIDGWTASCCHGPHAATTGALAAIMVHKLKYKPKTRLLELTFEVGEGVKLAQGETSAASMAAKSGKVKATGDAHKAKGTGTTTAAPAQQEPPIFRGCGIGTRPPPEQTAHDIVARVVAMLRPTTDAGRAALVAALDTASTSEADTTAFVTAALAEHVTDACTALQNTAYGRGYASAAYGGAAGIVARNKQRWYAGKGPSGGV